MCVCVCVCVYVCVCVCVYAWSQFLLDIQFHGVKIYYQVIVWMVIVLGKYYKNELRVKSNIHSNLKINSNFIVINSMYFW